MAPRTTPISPEGTERVFETTRLNRTRQAAEAAANSSTNPTTITTLQKLVVYLAMVMEECKTGLISIQKAKELRLMANTIIKALALQHRHMEKLDTVCPIAFLE